MEIENYTPGDEIAILGLFQTVFGKTMDIEYWRWRFLNNPMGTPQIKLMWHASELIGHYAVSPVKMDMDGVLVPAALSMTTMVHPAHNGKGYFPLLANELYDYYFNRGELDLVYGFPNQNSHYSFIRKLGWQDIAAIPTLSLVVKDLTLPLAEEVSVISRFTVEHERFIAERLAPYSVKMHRDAAYLNWRFFDHPSTRYAAFVHRRNEIDGIIIAKLYHSGDRYEIDLCEVFAIYDDAVIKRLVLSVIAHFRDYAPVKVNTWMNVIDEKHSALEKIGFTLREPITYLGLRDFKHPDKRLPSDRLFCSMGDSDIY